MHNNADVILAVFILTHDLLVVSIAQNSQYAALNAQRGFNDIGDIFHHILALALPVNQLLAADVGMLGQVIVGAIRHTPQLTPAEGEQELKVSGSLGIEAQLFGFMVAEPQVFVLQTDGQQPVVAESPPIIEPLKIGAGLAEELQFHLLKLPDAENEVARGDLIAERLADLADAERQFLPGGTLYVVEVYKDALSCLRTEIHRVLGILGDALKGLEHQVELADTGEIGLAAFRAGNVVLGDVLFEFFIAPAVDDDLRHTVGCMIIFNEFVRPKSGFAGLAVYQRVGESAHVSGCHPCLRVHQDRRVETDVVLGFLYKLSPPGVFDILFQFCAQRAVIPCIGQATVNFGTRIDKPSVLGKGNDFFHCYFSVYIAHVHSTYLSFFFAFIFHPELRMLSPLRRFPAQLLRFCPLLRFFAVLYSLLFSYRRKCSRIRFFHLPFRGWSL